jgi:hypothetical protein
MAESTVELPAVGNVDKKWLWIGGGTVAAVLAYAYWKRSQEAAVPVIEESVAGNDFLTDDGSGNVPGRTGDSSGQYGQDDVIDTMQEWTADVVEKLGWADWNTGFIYTTIGKWIAGEGLTPAEKALVLAAIVASGQPPGGPYPIKTAIPAPGGGDPPPPPPPPPVVVPQTLSVPLEYNLYAWVDDINRTYGLSLTFVRMFGSFKGDPSALNPDARQYMRWDNNPDGSSVKLPKFYAGWPGGGKTLGIPPMRIR